jgi:hypothetical protein
MNPRYGRVGMIGFPIILIMDILGPIAELSGYILVPLFYSLDLIDTEFILAFIALYFSMGIFISVFSLILEELSLRRFPRARDLMVLALFSILESFGYRQINNFWRFMCFWQYLRQPKKHDWGQMTRKGFTKS